MENNLKIILDYPELKKHLSQKPSDQKNVEKIIAEIAGNFNSRLVDITAKLLDLSLVKLYDNLIMTEPVGFDLKQAAQNHHVILVPNHQSHADYIALTYLIFKKYQLPVYVAGGINLNVFLVGSFFRHSGAFFIRRKFQGDELYKLTFEAYIYSLLAEHKTVEFFFEGGRSRTGKLLPPKFGLFQMLMEAHSHLSNKKPLMFIPIALAHEYVPEEKAHAKELRGAKKKKEKATHIFKIFKLINKRLGSIHVRFSEPILMHDYKDLKQDSYNLAFQCFKSVGRAMPVTPISLISLIMLNEPTGAMTWKQIEERALDVIQFCREFDIPLTPQLSGDDASLAIWKALNLLRENKKIEVINRAKLNQVYYSIFKDQRVAACYFKNMILHHFLVPVIMNGAWFNIFTGKIKKQSGLTKFLIQQRRELKFEFYLPTIEEMLSLALKIVSSAVGREISNLQQCMELTSPDLYAIAMKVKNFASSFSYIFEAYYLASITARHLANVSFSEERFIQVARELYFLELEHGRFLRYPESFSLPLMKSSLEYFINHEILKTEEKKYLVTDMNKLEKIIERWTHSINDQMSVNIKFSSH